MSELFSKPLRVALLSLTLAAGSAGMVSAQTGAPGGGTSDATRTQDTRPDRGSDWSWLGLLGLTGLAGLAGLLKRNGNAHRHDAGSVGGTTARR